MPDSDYLHDFKYHVTMFTKQLNSMNEHSGLDSEGYFKLV